MTVIQVLYKAPKSRIKINRPLSKSFDLKRGTRQGCPIGSLLFGLFMEALSQGVIQNSNITGVKMFVQEHKISLFAADVLIYFTEPNTSLPKLLLFLETFSSISCYKLDIQKAQI